MTLDIPPAPMVRFTWERGHRQHVGTVIGKLYNVVIWVNGARKWEAYLVTHRTGRLGLMISDIPDTYVDRLDTEAKIEGWIRSHAGKDLIFNAEHYKGNSVWVVQGSPRDREHLRLRGSHNSVLTGVII